MRLEKRIAGEKLNQDAPDTPDIAGERPAKAKDDLGCPVVAGRHDRGVVLVLEGGRAKINQSNLRVQEHLPLCSLTAHRRARRRNLPIVGKCLVFAVAQQDVLRLQIGVDQVQIMEDCVSGSANHTLQASADLRSLSLTSYARKELPREVLDLAVRKGHKVVALEEVEHALAQQVHNDADVAAEVEAVAEMDAAVPVLGIICPERLEHPQLDLARLAVFLHRADDLDGNKLVGDLISRLDHLAERALAEQLVYRIYFC